MTTFNTLGAVIADAIMTTETCNPGYLKALARVYGIKKPYIRPAQQPNEAVQSAAEAKRQRRAERNLRNAGGKP